MFKSLVRSVGVVSFASVVALASACTPARDNGGGGGGGNPPPPPRPIDAATAIATANANLRAVLGGAAHASVFADQSSVLKDLAGGSTDCTSSDPPIGGGGGSGTTDCGTSLDFSNDADDLADEISARALSVANIESAEATKVVLLLDPERACTAVAAGEAEPPPGNPPVTPTPDADCVAAFTATPLRLELTSRTEGDVDVVLLVGANKTRTVTLSLHAKEVAIELDLAAAKDAAEALITAFGGDASALPTTLSGRVRWSLEKDAEDVFTSTFAVLSTVRVTSTGSDPYDVEIGSAANAATVHIDGNTRELTASTAFGLLRVDLPLSSVYDSQTMTVSGTMRVALAALTGSVEVQGDADTVAIEGFGFGSDAFRMTVDGSPLIAVDLNASSGRKVDLTLGDAEGGLSVKVKPGLNIGVGLDMRTIESRVDDVPSWALDDDLTFALEGASEPEMVLDMSGDDVIEPGPGVPTPPATPTAIAKVAMGTLRVSSRAAAKTVSVSQGMCLLQTDPPEGQMSSHPVDQLSSGLCP